MPKSIDTGDGRLFFSVEGDGPLVVCAHGFPDCSRSFRLQLPALLDAGYRVATLEMRGYGMSEAARSGRYDAVALGNDLVAVANALSPDQPVSLLGHDWGAIAAYAAVARAPQRFSSIVTAAVPHLRVALRSWLHPRQLRRSWYMGLFQLRGIAERRVQRDDFALIDRLWRDWSPGYRCPPVEMQAIKAALRPNLTAVLSYYRSLLQPNRESLAAITQRTKARALYVHGMDDGCIGVELTQGIARAYTGGLTVHHIPRAGHFVHIEQPAAFNAHLLRFLGSPKASVI